MAKKPKPKTTTKAKGKAKPKAKGKIKPKAKPGAAPLALAVDTGPLEPQPGDEEIGPNDSADFIMSRVALACDDNTGVFFFRHNMKLFMRTVEF